MFFINCVLKFKYEPGHIKVNKMLNALLLLIGGSNVKMVNLSFYYHCESLQALKQ